MCFFIYLSIFRAEKLVLRQCNFTLEQFKEAFHRCKVNGSPAIDKAVMKMKVCIVYFLIYNCLQCKVYFLTYSCLQCIVYFLVYNCLQLTVCIHSRSVIFKINWLYYNVKLRIIYECCHQLYGNRICSSNTVLISLELSAYFLRMISNVNSTSVSVSHCSLCIRCSSILSYHSSRKINPKNFLRIFCWSETLSCSVRIRDFHFPYKKLILKLDPKLFLSTSFSLDG